jgi:chemotaxis signal transduction protein
VSVHVRMRVANEMYAMPVENVLEVAELGELATVPGARAEALGVRNLRGQILPVFDLAALFGVTRTDVPQKLVVAESDGRRAGFAIDEVSDVGELPDPAEETDSELLLGSALAGDDLIGVVDVRRLFAALEKR